MPDHIAYAGSKGDDIFQRLTMPPEAVGSEFAEHDRTVSSKQAFRTLKNFQVVAIRGRNRGSIVEIRSRGLIVVIPTNRSIDLRHLTPLIDSGARFIIVDDSWGAPSIF